MKYVGVSLLLLLVVVLSWAGFRGSTFQKTPLYIFPDMDFQWKVKPQDATILFPDGRGDRPVVRGTVPTLTDLGAHTRNSPRRMGFLGWLPSRAFGRTSRWDWARVPLRDHEPYMQRRPVRYDRSAPHATGTAAPATGHEAARHGCCRSLSRSASPPYPRARSSTPSPTASTRWDPTVTR
jgi:hypothetical protein